MERPTVDGIYMGHMILWHDPFYDDAEYVTALDFRNLEWINDNTFAVGIIGHDEAYYYVRVTNTLGESIHYKDLIGIDRNE